MSNPFTTNMAKNTVGMKVFKFNPNTDTNSLVPGTYVKYMYGVDSEHRNRMVGKIVRSGFSKKNNVQYYVTDTEYGCYVTTANDIYGFYGHKIKSKIGADKNATCIAMKLQHSEELPYMINTLTKMKNYIVRKNLGKILNEQIIDTNRSYSNMFTVSYPSGNIVQYYITDRNAHNIMFREDTAKKPHTFKVRNRKGNIELNFEKVKRMIKRFM